MLSGQLDIDFLFDISKKVKDFYETAVVFVTQKDYGAIIFDSICNIRTALKESNKNVLIDKVVDFHLQWLNAVNELEAYQEKIDDETYENVFDSIDYTVEAVRRRFKHYQRYIAKQGQGLSTAHQANLSAEEEIVEAMHNEVIQTLSEKMLAFRSVKDDTSFYNLLKKETEELLMWLDKIYDGLSLKLSKYANVHLPQLSDDLTKTLQQIVEEMKVGKIQVNKQILDELKHKGHELKSLIRYTAGHSLEISKCFEKLTVLEDRIKRLETENATAAVLALKNKKEYLERRIASLENLKTTTKQLKTIGDEDTSEVEECVCKDFYQLRIFNHSLPIAERERLVTELCFLWDSAIFGEGHQSMISILSATDMKEEYEDELGTFYIDEYSRRIYTKPDDEVLYQINERHELVPVSDDGEYIYFYDDCGRYFIDQNTKERVYKAHASASEYMLDPTGVLLKVKEVRDGIEYHYDNYGRFYVNDEGKHIYRDEDTVSEYENDGLGNLVRIRNHLDIFQPCPDDEHVTEDFKYLKQNVGQALRKCIAEVLLYQPHDPIHYLAMRLMKYRENLELRDRLAREREELEAEREIIAAEEKAAAERAAMEAALLMQGGSEASYDSNLINYNSLRDDEILLPGEKTE